MEKKSNKPKNTRIYQIIPQLDRLFRVNVVSTLLFTALHGMQTRSCDENSVRLSVRSSVHPSVRQTSEL